MSNLKKCSTLKTGYNDAETNKTITQNSIAKYHNDIDAIVIQFVNTTDFDGYTWSLSEIVYNRIVKI